MTEDDTYSKNTDSEINKDDVVSIDTSSIQSKSEKPSDTTICDDFEEMAVFKSGKSSKFFFIIALIALVVIGGAVIGVLFGCGILSSDNNVVSTESLNSDPVLLANPTMTPTPLASASTPANIITITDLNNPSKSKSINFDEMTSPILYSNQITFSDLVKSGRSSKIENMDQYKIKITNGIAPLTISAKYIYVTETYERKGSKDPETGIRPTYSVTSPETSQFCEICVYDSSGKLVKEDGFSGGDYGKYSTSSSSKINIYKSGDYEIVVRGDGMGVDFSIIYG